MSSNKGDSNSNDSGGSPSEKKTEEDVVDPDPATAKLPTVTLSDVQKAFPAESAEETIMMEDIERTDNAPAAAATTSNGPTDGAVQPPDPNLEHEISFVQQTATPLDPTFLQAMQQTKVEEFQQQQQKQEEKDQRDSSEKSAIHAGQQSGQQRPSESSTSSRRPDILTDLRKQESSRSKHRRSKTIEQQLFELTNFLDPLQMGEIEEEEDEEGRPDPTAEGAVDRSDVEGGNGGTTTQGGDDTDDDASYDEFEPLAPAPPERTQFQTFGANATRLFKNIQGDVQRKARKAKRRASLAVQEVMDEDDDVSVGGGSEDEAVDENERLETLKEVHRIIRQNRRSTFKYFWWMLLYVILPCLGVALLLFYGLGNPNGYNKVGGGDESKYASYSWFVIFFGIRQVLTFSAAVGIQFVLVTFYSQTGIQLFAFGPMTRLYVIQAKGAPLIMMIWAILDFILLYGGGQFANHWLFYQKGLEIFNASNPSGNFPNLREYKNTIIFMFGAGAAIATKRFFVGLRFSKSSYNRYADRLSDVLKQTVEVTKVARLAELHKIYKPRRSTTNDMLQAEWWLHRHAYELRNTNDIPAFLQSPTQPMQSTSAENSVSHDDHPDVTPNASNIMNAGDIAQIDGGSIGNNQNEENLQQPSLTGDSFNPTEMRAPKPRSSIPDTLTEPAPPSSDSVIDASSVTDTNQPPQPFGSTSLNLGLDTGQSISSAQQIKIDELLGDWEELEGTDTRVEEPSLSSIVQFGSSLGILESTYPFSQSFGYAKTRYDVVDRSQRVYNDLLKLQKKLGPSIPNSDDPLVLKFHTLCLLCLDYSSDSSKSKDSKSGAEEGHEIDQSKVKALMAVFRPTREGDITLVDFCKSVDSVYKEIRLLRASVENEGKVNTGAEKLINVIFYGILLAFAFAAIGIDPVVLFGGLSAFIISWSFCVSGASSDYIRGLLFILIQRPYDIGDRVSLASATFVAPGTFSPQWVVKDLGLYHTTFIFGASQEYATISNGVLSQLRVINAARSPHAIQYFNLKFGIDVDLETVEIFEQRLMEFVKARPRQWLKPVCFRITGIFADLGYVEYIVGLQHREGWQQVGAVLTSTGEVQQFCFKVTAELGMGYNSPPLPIQFQTRNPVNGISQNNNNETSNAFTAHTASEALDSLLNPQAATTQSIPHPQPPPPSMSGMGVTGTADANRGSLSDLSAAV